MKKIFLAIGFLSIFFSSSNIALAADSCSWTKADASSNYGNTTLSCPATRSKENINGSRCSGSRPLFYLCCCSPVATETKVTAALFTIPDFQVKIPGLDKLPTITCVKGEECSIPWIGQYIAGIYNYALAIVGILAAIVLMAGGVMWIISAGDASKITQAKELIIGSISGLIILVSSYTILILINPDLVNLKSIDVASIKEVDIETLENGSDSAGNAVGTCASYESIASISDLVSTSAASPYLMPDAVNGLSLAIAEAAKQGSQLQVTSAFRTAEYQQELWDAAIEKYGTDIKARKWVAPPGSCGGHRSGKAIDVCLKGTNSCNHMGGSTNGGYTDLDVEKLKGIMRAAGWVRYCAEWWHYQYNQPQNSPCP